MKYGRARGLMIMDSIHPYLLLFNTIKTLGFPKLRGGQVQFSAIAGTLVQIWLHAHMFNAYALFVPKVYDRAPTNVSQ